MYIKVHKNETPCICCLILEPNTETIDFEEISEEDAADLKAIIEKHLQYTNSAKGASLLSDWPSSLNSFVKVMPTEYKRALERIATEEPMFEELTKA